MNYQIGNEVIHQTHGPGKIIAIDEKSLEGQTHRYYVVETRQLTLWVRTNEAGEKSIRPPAESFEFKGLMKILSSPGESLPDQHYDRKNQLFERMQKRKLVEICRVIRDLTSRSQFHNLNENDRSILKQAEECLVDEWEISLGTARSNAYQELEMLLNEAHSA